MAAVHHLRVLSVVPEGHVISQWAMLYARGKQAGYAPPDLDRWRGRSPWWVLLAVPHHLYSADYNSPDTSLSPSQVKRSHAYARSGTPLPPGIALFRGRGGSRRAYVADGNHRAYAAYLRGEPGVHLLMPEPDAVRFMAANGQDIRPLLARWPRR